MRWRIFLGLVLLSVAGPSPAGLLRDGDPARDLRPVPAPDTARMPPATVESLHAAEEYFDLDAPELDQRGLALAYGMIGVRYQAHQLNSAAEAAYLNAIQLAPEVFNWRYYLGFLKHETGDFDAAVERYREALEIRPDYRPARMRIGLVALEAGDLQTAERSFRAVLSESPDEAAAIAGLGRVAAGRGDHDAAAKYFRRALEIQPAADRLHYRLGLALRQMGKMEAARDHLNRRGDTEPVFADSELAFMQTRARPPAFFRDQAMRALRERKLEEARFNLELAVEIDPSSVPDRIRLARVHLLQDDVEAASRQVDRAAREATDDPLVSVFRGHLAVHEGDDGAALDAYRRAADAGHPPAWVFAADALMRLGRYQEAAEAYGELDDEPRIRDHWNTELLQAVALLAAGDCGPALAALESLREASGDGAEPDPNRRIVRIRADATCPGLGPERRRQALSEAQAIHAEVRTPATAETLAMALAANGRTDEAAAIIREILFQGLVAGQPVPGQAGLEAQLARYEAGETPREPFAADSPLVNPRRIP